ncbi:MAG: family 20 glycosylhydrolase [Actinomycetaceae bacterium]|nr:family 20 glycosylhydrolase [Actinomycetaceae bacterium]
MKFRRFAAFTSVAALAFAALTPAALANDSAAGGGWDGAAAQIELPSTVPSFDGFTESAGTWTLAPGARIVTDTAEAHRAEMLSTELTAYLGQSVPAVSGVAATDKDVRLVLDGERTDLGDEGFEMRIGEDGLAITAAKDAGIFYGTRTLSQLLRQESRGDQQLVLPGGSGKSVPKYSERGVILCACQINISPEWVDRFLDDIADLGINQVLMEMKVKSDTHPDTNTWSYYTKADVEKFVQKADNYNIDVIPEINSPGHMNIWLENSPQYQLVNSAGQYQPDRLDISMPEARQLYKDLIDEYDGVFTTDYWHMGADEYMIGSAYASYPQLARYAQDTFGPSATANDAFNAFINEVYEHVKAKGKQLRVFNDGVKRSAQQKINTDVVVDYWLNQAAYTPQQFLDDGYKLMNTSQSLYWSRQMAYGVNPQNLYNTGWNVGKFDGGVQIDREHPNLLGARVSLWPDNSYMTENEVELQTADSIAFLAQMTWSASNPWPRWEGTGGMKSAIDAIGKPTIRTKVAGADIAPGVYAFSELTPVGQGPWQITPTYDGYYQVRDTASGQCLTIDQNATKHLSVVTEVGARAALAECKNMNVQWPNRGSDSPMARTHQKWQIVQRDSDKVSMRNAITNQYLAVVTGNERHVDIQGVSAPVVVNNPAMLERTASGEGNRVAAGTLAQLPADLVSANGVIADNALFTMARDMGMSADPGSVTNVDPTTWKDVTVTLYAPSDADLPASTVSVQLSEGWRALPDTVSIPEMPAGSTATAVFRVQNTTATEGTAEFRWTAGDEEATTSVSLQGIVGPRLCGGFTDITASSEERGGEGPVSGYVTAAFDTNADGTAKMDTFWHTRWNGGFDQFPFWVVFNPTAALDGNYMTTIEYAPRQNKVNGRIKSYEIYLSSTAKAGSEDWGEAVLTGELANSTEWQAIKLPPNTPGQYVKFQITDVWDEVPGREDSFAAAAGFCVASAVPAADLEAPAQPENPVVAGEEFHPGTPAGGDPVVPIALDLPTAASGHVLSEIDPINVNITVDPAKGYVLGFAPNLPKGLQYDATSGQIVGTPEAEFDGDVTVTLTQRGQTKTATIRLTITKQEVTPAASSNADADADDPVSCTVSPYAEVTPMEGVEYALTITNAAGEQRTATPDENGRVDYGYGETITITASAKPAYKFPAGATDKWTWTAPTKESLNCDAGGGETDKPGESGEGTVTPPPGEDEKPQGDGGSTDGGSTVVPEVPVVPHPAGEPSSAEPNISRMPDTGSHTVAAIALMLALLGAGSASLVVSRRRS